MIMPKGVKIALAVLVLIFMMLVIYGIITDCPHTAGYFFCSESERWELRD